MIQTIYVGNKSCEIYIIIVNNQSINQANIKTKQKQNKNKQTNKYNDKQLYLYNIK